MHKASVKFMQKNILLTSFATWKQHQVTNSSDDMLGHVINSYHKSMHYLRKVPVDHRLAPKKILEKFDALEPDILVCCGMAEKRKKLNLESRARIGEKSIETDVDLKELAKGLSMTRVSHDAGKFVCNTLYFRALTHIKKRPHRCIFVHVPVLTEDNLEPVKSNFITVLDRLSEGF